MALDTIMMTSLVPAHYVLFIYVRIIEIYTIILQNEYTVTLLYMTAFCEYARLRAQRYNTRYITLRQRYYPVSHAVCGVISALSPQKGGALLPLFISAPFPPKIFI